MKPCNTCPLLICDTLNPMCEASAELKMKITRYDMRSPAQQRADALKSVASLGMKKYDRRRAPDTPRRAWDRKRKRKLLV